MNWKSGYQSISSSSFYNFFPFNNSLLQWSYLNINIMEYFHLQLYIIFLFIFKSCNILIVNDLHAPFMFLQLYIYIMIIIYFLFFYHRIIYFMLFPFLFIVNENIYSIFTFFSANLQKIFRFGIWDLTNKISF